MNNHEHVSNYLTNADELSLTPEERTAARIALEACMTISLTQDEKVNIRRALQQAIFSDSPASSWSWSLLPFRLPVLAFSLLLLIAASGGGIVYAAENALPGDPLYPVKIHVNEEVRARLSHTPEARAQWAVARLERRMQELKRLEARGDLNADVEVQLANDIEVTAHDIDLTVEALPAAAAERAALRTAVHAAIGTEQDDVRRGARVVHVLKALRERAEGFDTPSPDQPHPIVPVPAVGTGVHVEGSASSSANVHTSSSVSSHASVGHSSTSSASVQASEVSSVVSSDLPHSSDAFFSSSLNNTASSEPLLPPLPINPPATQPIDDVIDGIKL